MVERAVKGVASDMVVNPRIRVADAMAAQQMASTYSVSQMLGRIDVQADSGGETEAGTVQRDVIRSGVVTIPVAFSVSPKWLKMLTEFRKKAKIKVDFFDTEILEVRRKEMYIDGYKASLVKDTSYKGLWKVSFALKEF